VAVLQRQAALRGILRQRPPPTLRAMLRQTIAWVQQPSAAKNANANGSQRDSNAWVRRVSELPEHELRQRRQVQHAVAFCKPSTVNRGVHRRCTAQAVLSTGGCRSQPMQLLPPDWAADSKGWGRSCLAPATDPYVMHRCKRSVPEVMFPPAGGGGSLRGRPRAALQGGGERRL
jgi:hypothetical protein